MKQLRHRFVLFMFAGAALAAAASDENRNVFSLLPKSLQKKPLVDLNIITEMTPEGRRSPPAALATPVYFVSKSGGLLQLGMGASTNEDQPAFERLEKMLEASLARSGYLPATKDHPPTLAIIYSWGAHSSMIPEDADDPLGTKKIDPNDPDSNQQLPGVSTRLLLKELIDRARLVGGEKFADELQKALVDELDAIHNSGSYRYSPEGLGGDEVKHPDILTDYSFISPVERFRQRSAKHRALFEDALRSVYFVIASAYDFNALAANSRILLWRTKMSVNSSGLAMAESLPTLITAAAPYFGKDMLEVEVLTQRLNREGSVRLGPLEVKEYNPGGTAPAKAPPSAPSKDGAPSDQTERRETGDDPK